MSDMTTTTETSTPTVVGSKNTVAASALQVSATFAILNLPFAAQLTISGGVMFK